MMAYKKNNEGENKDDTEEPRRSHGQMSCCVLQREVGRRQGEVVGGSSGAGVRRFESL